MTAEVELVRGLLNASFAQRGYYTEIDADEMAYQVDGLSHLIDESIALVLLEAGTPVAFVLSIPDISDFVRKVRGNLGLGTSCACRRRAAATARGDPGDQGHAARRTGKRLHAPPLA